MIFLFDFKCFIPFFKVLHLMNKMNLPTPFGPITTRPPMVRKLLEFSTFKISFLVVRLLRLNFTNVVPVISNIY